MSQIEYGTLGHVEYSSESQTWKLLRRNKQAQQITPIGEPTTVVSASVNDDIPNKGAVGGRQDLTKRLTRRHSEFVPAVDCIVDLYEESSAIQSISQWNLSRPGPLLAIGHATDSENILGGTHPFRKVLAYITVLNGDQVAISYIGQRRWESQYGIIKNPKLTPQVGVIFSADGPIQQIDFATDIEDEKSKPYLVIRALKSTVILQIFYRRGPTKDNPLYHARQVGEIINEMTGGDKQIHFSINPWVGNQLAIIDIQGRWSIWKFKTRRSHRNEDKNTNLTKVASNKLNSAIKDEAETYSWANIAWNQPSGQIVIGLRNGLYIVDTVTGDHGDDIFDGDAIETIKDAEILSVRNDMDRKSIIVLTNYSVNFLDADLQLAREFSWRHYRHPEDSSLAYVTKRNDTGMWMLLHSRFNSHVSVLKIYRTGTQLHSVDFGIIQLERMQFPSLTIVVLDVQVGYQEYNDAGALEFFPMIVLNTNLEVSRHDFATKQDFEFIAQVNPRRKSKNELLSKEFIESDDEDSMLGIDGDAENKIDGALDLDFGKLSLNLVGAVQYPTTVMSNFGDLYSEIFDDEDSCFMTGKTSENQSVAGNYVENLRISLRNRTEMNNGCVLTLFLVHEPTYLFDDFGHLLQEIKRKDLFENLVQEIKQLDLSTVTTENQSLSLFKLSQERDNMNQTDSQQNKIAGSYGVLTKLWLSTLPSFISSKVRLRRERLARIISADISLASHGLYPVIVTEKQPARHLFEAMDVENHISAPIIDNQLPTSTFQDELMTGMSDAESRASSRSRATSIGRKLFLENFTPVTHTSTAGNEIDGLMDDWVIDSSPDQYQWQPVWEAQRRDAESVRTSRKKSRLARSRASSVGGSQRRPEIAQSDYLPMTQPDPRILTAPSSSQLSGSQRFPASQVQRGKFGDSRKAKKKRRTEGF